MKVQRISKIFGSHFRPEKFHGINFRALWNPGENFKASKNTVRSLLVTSNFFSDIFRIPVSTSELFGDKLG